MYTAIQRDLDLPGTLNAVETAEKIKDEQVRMMKAVEKRDPPSTSTAIERVRIIFFQFKKFLFQSSSIRHDSLNLDDTQEQDETLRLDVTQEDIPAESEQEVEPKKTFSKIYLKISFR